MGGVRKERSVNGGWETPGQGLKKGRTIKMEGKEVKRWKGEDFFLFYGINIVISGKPQNQ